MKTKILISLAVIAVGALICLGAAGPMTFSTLHPTNNAYGVLESTSWLPYKQTESLAILADTVTGGKVAVDASVSATVTSTEAAPLWITLGPTNSFAATQSGTWTVQPGNTANTTPWLFAMRDQTNAYYATVLSDGSIKFTMVNATDGNVTNYFKSGANYVPANADASGSLYTVGTNTITDNLPISTNKVGGFMTFCKGYLTNDQSASYAAGDVFAKIFTCTNAARESGGSVTWQSLKLFNGDDTNFNFEAFIFTQIPASLTASNTVWSVSTADLASYCCGYYCSTNGAWSDLGTNQIFTANNLAQPMKADAGTNDLFLAIRLLSTCPQGTNYPAIRAGFWQD